MSLRNNVKDLISKGQEAAAKNSGKINQAVDKASGFIDQKTKGKYTDKIEKGKAAAKKMVPPEHPDSPGSAGPTGPTDPGPAGPTTP